MGGETERDGDRGMERERDTGRVEKGNTLEPEEEKEREEKEEGPE